VSHACERFAQGRCPTVESRSCDLLIARPGNLLTYDRLRRRATALDAEFIIGGGGGGVRFPVLRQLWATSRPTTWQSGPHLYTG